MTNVAQIHADRPERLKRAPGMRPRREGKDPRNPVMDWLAAFKPPSFCPRENDTKSLLAIVNFFAGAFGNLSVFQNDFIFLDFNKIYNY